MKIVEKAHAKINLAQDILHENSGTWHEVAMVMSSIDLSDYVTIESIPQHKIIVETSRGFLPENEKNLAYQAAKLMFKNTQRNDGVRVFIEKNIPVSAGLGGGSSDAAAVIRGLVKLWKLDWSVSRLIEIGIQIDQDVPYTLVGGTCAVTGHGEIIQPLNKIPPCWVVVAKPPISITTRRIFNQLSNDTYFKNYHLEQVVEALQNGDYTQLMASIGNSLEERTFQRFPELKRLKQKMQQFGAQGVTMTGTGSTIIGFTTSLKKGQHINNALRGFCKEVYLVRIYQERYF